MVRGEGISMGKKSIAGELIVGYLEDETYSGWNNRALARLIYKENPELFKNVDGVRSIIRYNKGAMGDEQRKKCSDKRFYDTTPTEDNKFALPEGEIIDWKPYYIPDSCNKMLILGDLHIPYHDKDAIEIALQYGLDHGCDSLVLNGDVMDCYGVSSFQKDPRVRNMAEEVDAVKNFFSSIRDNVFPTEKIIYKEGNHENRLGRYMQRCCPELIGGKDSSFIKGLDEVLELEDYGIKWVDGMRPMYCGKLNIVHGHEFGGKSGGINPARNTYMKAKECCLTSHWHRMDQYIGKTVRDRSIACWSVGCLCELHPDYCPSNDWSLGFAIIERDDDDWFEVHNKRILENRVV